jgi:hypothetical protein
VNTKKSYRNDLKQGYYCLDWLRCEEISKKKFHKNKFWNCFSCNTTLSLVVAAVDMFGVSMTFVAVVVVVVMVMTTVMILYV